MLAGAATIPLEMLTTRPQTASSMPGRTAAVSAAGATTLISNARRTSADAMPTVGPSGSTVAASLTRMSTLPVARTAAAARSRSSSSARSAGTRLIRPRGGPLTQQGACLVQLPCGAGEHDDAGACVGQPERDGAADAAPGTGDQCGLASEVSCHCGLPNG